MAENIEENRVYKEDITKNSFSEKDFKKVAEKFEAVIMIGMVIGLPPGAILGEFSSPRMAVESSVEKEAQTQKESQEFSESMIKNRLLIGEEDMPIWYVGELGPENHCTIVSGVVVDEPSISESQGDGIYSSKEVTVSIAFQNPTTKEFIIRKLSFPYMPILFNTGVAYFEKFQFLDEKNGNGFVSTDKIHYDDDNDLQQDTTGMQMVEELKVGDQIAFGLTTTRERFYGYLPEKEIENIPSQVKEIPYFQKIEKEAVKNNKAIVEAMKNNEEIPELTLYTEMFFVGVEDLESVYPTSAKK